MPSKTITLTLDEYNELIEGNLKAKQYKTFLLDNATNIKICKALEMIECEKFYKLVLENETNRKGEEKCKKN